MWRVTRTAAEAGHLGRRQACVRSRRCGLAWFSRRELELTLDPGLWGRLGALDGRGGAPVSSADGGAAAVRAALVDDDLGKAVDHLAHAATAAVTVSWR